MPASKARRKLGPAAVIGCTANTFDDITAVSSLDIDYFGVGPYHDTTTKKRLAPVLDVDGIRDIVTQMRQAEINIPVGAVGGIRLYFCVLQLLAQYAQSAVCLTQRLALGNIILRYADRVHAINHRT